MFRSIESSCSFGNTAETEVGKKLIPAPVATMVLCCCCKSILFSFAIHSLCTLATPNISDNTSNDHSVLAGNCSLVTKKKCHIYCQCTKQNTLPLIVTHLDIWRFGITGKLFALYISSQLRCLDNQVRNEALANLEKCLQ